MSFIFCQHMLLFWNSIVVNWWPVLHLYYVAMPNIIIKRLVKLNQMMQKDWRKNCCQQKGKMLCCWIIVSVQAPCTRVLTQGYFRLALLFNCCKWLYRIRYISSQKLYLESSCDCKELALLWPIAKYMIIPCLFLHTYAQLQFMDFQRDGQWCPRCCEEDLV